MNDLGLRRRAGPEVQDSKRYRELKAAGSAGSRIEIEHSLAMLNVRLVRMSVEDDGKACGSWIEMQSSEIVKQIQVVVLKDEDVCCRQATARAGAIDVAADCVDRRSFGQGLEDFVLSYVAEVQNPVDLRKGRDHLGAQETVCVTYDAEFHRSEPKTWYHFFLRGSSVSELRNGSTTWRNLPGFFGSSMARQYVSIQLRCHCQPLGAPTEFFSR